MGSLLLRMVALCGVLASALTWSASVSAQHEPTSTRRFALIVGANDGGAERAKLRYAQRDAKAVASVLEQLGGVDAGDRVLLLEPSPSQLTAALAQLEQRALKAREAGQRTELLFYYSGHSDERGLLLGESRLSYRDVRDGLVSVGAAVHIGVLDSCSSGALTRLKGGVRRAPFLLDKSNAVQGHAFLTSSSADEGAQESDRVGASYFTHFLVSGLRGAGDFNSDGRVTLNEAYRFAFDETLARTEGSRAGPQHAAYDIQLVGTGDLVMTDLRQPAAALLIPKAVSGRMYVRDESGNLVVELNKPAGRTIELALDAKQYQVLLDRDGQLSRGTIALAANTITELNPATFTAVKGEQNALRGGEPVTYQTVGFGFGLVPPYSVNERFGGVKADSKVRVRNNFALHFLWGRSHRLDGVGLSLGGSRVFDQVNGVQGSLGVNLAGNVNGVQSGIVYNGAKRVYGVQFSVGVSVSEEYLLGAQGAFVNLAEKADGVQFGLVNGARKMGGIQAALFNHAEEELVGVQWGLLNLTRAPHAKALQASMFNWAKGRMQGLQFGLVNFADRASAQIGLISATRKGGVHALAFMSDVMPLQVGMRMDAEYTYSSLLLGYSPEKGKDTYSMGFGLGGKIPLVKGLWLEPELSYQVLAINATLKHGNPSTLNRLALQLRYSLLPHVSVFGGPSFSAIIHSQDRYHDERPGLWKSSLELKSDSNSQILGTFGFTAGVSL